MLFLITIANCSKFRVKLADEGKYFQKNESNEYVVVLGEYKDSEVYEIDYKEDKPNLKWLYPQSGYKKALGFEKNKKELTSVDASKNTDQQVFKLVPFDLSAGTYWIVYNDKCVTWKPKDQYHILEPCYDNSKEQLFVFEHVKDDKKTQDAKNDIFYSAKQHTRTKLLQKNTKAVALQNLIESNKSNLLSSYKTLYDLTLCLGNNGVCVGNDVSSTTKSSLIIKTTSS